MSDEAFINTLLSDPRNAGLTRGWLEYALGLLGRHALSEILSPGKLTAEELRAVSARPREAA
ncbi:hypothetical protein HOU02_gp294 [Caulobacter phage CcrBL9]|uniref:Uncharacterized protein n=1 Tax=Caulobacter phage CcrBL9 TaxID=2283270 RepID=A0A385EC20_9CAUD|nr:hypothetical protein HOU02_gp294 [Caulobacter phage CcrBL9]AXQ69431.1 hypothetical protein CcrBL9_gp407 [Caulobacter phage CcrBL9]